MLGMAALAELALAELPLGAAVGAGIGSPAWRRWMAQKYPGKILNRVPDPDLVHAIVDDDETLIAILMATLH